MVNECSFVPLSDLMNLWKLDWIVNYLCDGLYLKEIFVCFRFKWFMFLICFAWHHGIFFFVQFSSQLILVFISSSCLQRNGIELWAMPHLNLKIVQHSNTYTFLNRIQRNLIKIKFSDKILLSHRTEMDSLKRKCHQICMNLFRFDALFSLYHTHSHRMRQRWREHRLFCMLFYRNFLTKKQCHLVIP